MNNLKFSATLTVQYKTPFSPFEPQDFDKGLSWVHSSGFDGAELCISNYDGIDVQEIKRKLDAHHLGCSTISTGQARSLENISLLHEGDALRAAQHRMCRHIDAASILGCKVTLGLLRGLGRAGYQKEDKAALARNLEPVLDYAQARGVTIILECINRYETTLFNDASSAVNFIKNDLGNPSCAGILWDLFHANIEDPSFEGAVEVFGDKLKHVHIADSNRMFPGYGHTNFKGICRLLVEAGFTDYLSFECFNLPSREIVLAKSKDFISAMREV